MEYMYKGLAHIGIMTDDPEGCAKFYIDNLDFRLMHVADRGDFKIAFVENGGVILEFIGRGRREAEGTIAHFCFEVVNIDKTVERLIKNGVKCDSEKANVMEGLLPFPVKNFFFTGPAGEKVELFDYSGL